MQDRRSIGKDNAVSSGKVIDPNLSFGRLERPGQMVDVTNEHAASKGSEEAVAFRQEVFEAAGLARCSGNARRHAAVGRVESRAEAAEETPTLILDTVLRLSALHGSKEIRQMKDCSCAKNSQRACAIQREEEDSSESTSRRANVGAEVQLREGTGIGNGDGPLAITLKGKAVLNLIHPEGDDSYPCETVVEVKLKICRDEWSQRRDSNRPVCEEEIVPALTHPPGAGGQWSGLIVRRSEHVPESGRRVADHPRRDADMLRRR